MTIFPEIIHGVRTTIARHAMLTRGDRVGVAVSGGSDSVALLRILALLRDEYGIDLVVLHFNHGLRAAASDADEAFVRELSREMGLPLVCGRRTSQETWNRIDGSSEDELRDARYSFFEETVVTHGLTRVALGHTANDQAETVIIKFLRGSGAEGLRGIPPCRDKWYIRPLIAVERNDLITFLTERGWDYRTDSSNEETVFLRNRIRHELLPVLKRDYNQKLIDCLVKTADVLYDEDDYVKVSVRKILSQWDDPHRKDVTILDVDNILRLHRALARRLVKTCIEAHCVRGVFVEYNHVAAVMDLIRGNQPNGWVTLAGGVVVKRRYGSVSIFSREREKNGREISDKEAMDDYFYYDVSIPGTVDVREADRSIVFDFVDRKDIHMTGKDRIYFQTDCVEYPLAVRSIRPGDRIAPLGLNGSKKVKNIFIDMKVPRDDRRRVPLLVDARGVLWVAGMTVDERCRIDEMSGSIVVAEIV